jgi:hypothetical protein
MFKIGTKFEESLFGWFEVPFKLFKPGWVSTVSCS